MLFAKLLQHITAEIRCNTPPDVTEIPPPGTEKWYTILFLRMVKLCYPQPSHSSLSVQVFVYVDTVFYAGCRPPILSAVYTQHDHLCTQIPVAVHRVQVLFHLWHFR